MKLKQLEKFLSFNGKLFIFFTLFVIIIALPISVHAVHKGAGDLTCGACHTMHNSQGGTDLGGNSGGSLILLRGKISTRADIHKLCLQCHASNGTMADVAHAPRGVKAPKVYSSGSTWTQDDPFNLIGAGGNFSTELNATWDATTSDYLGYGHSVGATNVTPPGGDASIDAFSCTNCHDPHGTSDPTDSNINIFRNLRVNVLGAGDNSGVKFSTGVNSEWENKSYVGGENGSYFGGSETDNDGRVIWPVYKGTLSGNPVTDSANSNQYGTGDDGILMAFGYGTMSLWCAQCHDKWHEEIESNNQAHVYDGGEFAIDLHSRRHAVNSMMPRAAAAGCAGTCHESLLDRSNYDDALIQAGKGLPVTASQYYTANAYYLPTGGTGMDDFNDGHKVFCLTCHFAHGGPHYDNLRWNYTSAVSSGDQEANAIPSNVGCQLCHSR